jgi:hypothetical protein
MKNDFFAWLITEDVSDWTCSGLRKSTVGDGMSLIAEMISVASRVGAPISFL